MIAVEPAEALEIGLLSRDLRLGEAVGKSSEARRGKALDLHERSVMRTRPVEKHQP